MSELSPGGTTAIQVSPADLAEAKTMIAKFSAIVAKVEELQADNDSLRSDLHSTRHILATAERDGADKANRIFLLETQLEGEHREHEVTKADRDGIAANCNRLNDELQQARRDRDDIGFKHLEVSEELAQANATLGKFRELLGFGAASQGISAGSTQSTIAAPEPVSVNEGPFVHVSNSTLGGGDNPVTQEAASGHPEQHDDPALPVRDERAANSPPVKVEWPGNTSW